MTMQLHTSNIGQTTHSNKNGLVDNNDSIYLGMVWKSAYFGEV